MRILAFETSCDETSVASVVDGTFVESCVIASSKNDFAKMGGVIPEEAARKQLEVILPSLTLALSEAKITWNDIDAIAVTNAPGLLGSLLVGTATARMLSELTGLPLIPVHHTLGHLNSTFLSEKNDDIPSITFPLLTLSVSGGHSDLWYRTSHTVGKRIGTTRDDAAGEAFDKGATLFGLPYPGGPALSRMAEPGDPHSFSFPLPLAKEPGYDFSFSGLKTSLKYTLNDLSEEDRFNETLRSNVAASYEYAISHHLLHQIEKALDDFPLTRELHIVGGVSANTRLRKMAHELGGRCSLTVRTPQTLRYCTDNAAMIAAAAYFLYQEKGEQIFYTDWTTTAVQTSCL